MKREVIKGSGTPAPMAHYCEGVLAGETLYAAGQIASDYRTGVPPEARQDPAFPYYGSDIQKQARYILGNLRKVLHAGGCELKDVVKSQVFLLDLDDFNPFDRVWKEFFPSPPPRTTVQVSGLLVPGCKVEIDLWAVQPKVQRQVITGKTTPTPMAHYCQGVLAGDTLYAAGQIASDYKTGVPAEARQDPAFPYYGSDIQKQARYVLENLKSVFDAAGCSFKDVVKSQVFLTDLDDFFHFDQVWKEFFPAPPPRTTVQISKLLVPGCKVEIDHWGVLPKVKRQIITGKNTPTPMAHYCQGILAGDTLYAAGQIASDYKTGVPPEARQGGNFPFYGSDIELQTEYVLKNLAKTFAAAGSSLDHVVKAQVFLTDLANFHRFDSVWKRY